jgi:dTDP-4-dehydrorhamnose reductase
MQIETTPIPGLLVVRLDVHGDARGWFKENWQREKMLAGGLPDFGPVQNNISFNAERGATRGIHTEPWDKFVSVATGRVFAAWVDMREGDSFGTTFWIEIDESVAVFVPRGVGNSYQALEDGTAYTYLVNAHWRPGHTYPALHLGAARIPWPIPLEEAEISGKDQNNPVLDGVVPMLPKKALITGCKGQLGRALAVLFPHSDGVDLDELDLTDAKAVAAWPWEEYDVVLNAAAYTAVDGAETDVAAAWAGNAAVPANLARAAREHGLTLVHYSTDYVFDGTEEMHDVDEPLSPLGVYGQSKAAGELAAAGAPRHYVLRTSWLIGDGKNFVRTMASLADSGVSPTVVDDQIGRLTFTDELARATQHLIDKRAAYGIYHVTNGGPATSWCDLAKAVFQHRGRNQKDVTGISTEEYADQQRAAGKVFAPRPLNSVLDLSRLEGTGFKPGDAMAALTHYLTADASVVE